MAEEEENCPLLCAEATEADLYHSKPDNVPSAPLYQGEAPPPYQVVPAVGFTSVSCGVCGAQNAVNANRGQRIAKCTVCHEATPIKDPPEGKKFVRCSCHCLLLCSVSSKRVACPRPQCKRVMELTGVATSSAAGECYVMRARCGYCSQTFLGPPSGQKKSVRCPHCRKVSFIGQRFPINRCVYFSLMGIFFAVAAGGLIAATVQEARDYPAIYAVWVFLLFLCVVCVCWAVYWARVKISTPLPSSSV